MFRACLTISFLIFLFFRLSAFSEVVQRSDIVLKSAILTNEDFSIGDFSGVASESPFSVGGFRSDVITDIAVDKAGHVYVTGDLGREVVTFGSTSLISDGNFFITRLDARGSVLWAKDFGEWARNIGSRHSSSSSIIADGAGNIYVVGNVDIGGLRGKDVFVVKVDTSSGRVLWSRSLNFGDNSQEIANGGVIVDCLGNIYIAGTFGVGPDAISGFVFKMSSFGEMLWFKSFGGSPFVSSSGLVIDNFGNIYVIGIFEGSLILDDAITLTSVGKTDVFVAKIHASGKILWAKGFGGNSNDEDGGIAIDSSNAIYVAGTFQDTIDAVPTISSTGESDIFVFKVDSFGGEILWAKNYGNASHDHVCGIAIDVDTVCMTAVFHGNVILDTFSLSPRGESDVSFIKIDPLSGVVTFAEISEDIFEGGMD